MLGRGKWMSSCNEVVTKGKREGGLRERETETEMT